jgi:threonine aldolase
MEFIDIRSDTVTKPSKAMREAIYNAEVGDDVFGEDPTVIKLQNRCAEISGKEKALFVPTGCMANQLAIKSHTEPGDEVICESECHILNYETAAPAVISNVQLNLVRGINGVMNPADIENLIRPKDYYFPRTRLITLENTHNRGGGTIQPIENIKEISALAKSNGIKIHMDGARIFNASVETGIPVKDYASYVDSISFCFSKGLGAPVGSILCGDAGFITKAHKWRKVIGGGMRQAGILASAAIYALDNNIYRLKEDHVKARYFASEIARLKSIDIDLKTVQTNILLFEVRNMSRTDFIKAMKEKGVLFSAGNLTSIRAVFHLDVSMEQAERAAKAVAEVLS